MANESSRDILPMTVANMTFLVNRLGDDVLNEGDSCGRRQPAAACRSHRRNCPCCSKALIGACRCARTSRCSLLDSALWRAHYWMRSSPV